MNKNNNEKIYHIKECSDSLNDDNYKWEGSVFGYFIFANTEAELYLKLIGQMNELIVKVTTAKTELKKNLIQKVDYL